MQTVMDLFLDSGVKQMIICNKTNNAMLPIVCQSLTTLVIQKVETNSFSQTFR